MTIQVQDLADRVEYTDKVLVVTDNYDRAGSRQAVAGDLVITSATAGSSSAADTDFLAGVMGNIIRASGGMTATANLVGGVIGHYSIVGANSTTFPAGGVLAGVGDGTADRTVHGVVAYIDGDSAQTTGGAAYKVMCNNSTAGSNFDYGIDLSDAAHDGFIAVDESFYGIADMRLSGSNIVKSGNGSPEGAVTAGVGSLFLRLNGGASTTLYVKESGAGNTGWVAK